MNRPGQKTAMISSTALDLPEHRRQAIEACQRAGVFPIPMENLAARDDLPVDVCMEMVDQADIYIGVYGWRYGWVPPGQELSITEMEFDRAEARKRVGKLKEILIFLMHEDHPLTSMRMVEADATAQQKLAEFKKRATAGRIRVEFKSPEDLRAHIIQALGEFKEREQSAAGEKAAPDFHPPNIIPKAPEPYIAHPYSLLQTKDVVGRQAELNLSPIGSPRTNKCPPTRASSIWWPSAAWERAR